MTDIGKWIADLFGPSTVTGSQADLPQPQLSKQGAPAGPATPGISDTIVKAVANYSSQASSDNSKAATDGESVKNAVPGTADVPATLSAAGEGASAGGSDLIKTLMELLG